MLRFVLIALSFLSGSVLAAPNSGFLEAERDFVNGDIPRAIEKLEALSNSEHVAAQSFLGLLYFDGIFVEQDFAKAASFLEPAAAQGDPEANYNLAMMLEASDGIGQPSKKSAHHLMVAARAGHPVAQFIVGGRYYTGQGVSKDTDQGLEWAKKSFANGYVPALSILAIHEMLAGGAEKDDRTTFRKLLRYSREGLGQIYLTLGFFYVGGMGGAVEDDDEALKWFYLAWVLDHPKAMETLTGFLAKQEIGAEQAERGFRGATRLLMSIAADNATYIGRAAHWCRRNDRFRIDCIRKSVERHQMCRAPFFPGHFQNYSATRAYHICREKLEATSE